MAEAREKQHTNQLSSRLQKKVNTPTLTASTRIASNQSELQIDLNV